MTIDEILDSYWIAAVDVSTSSDFESDGARVFAKGSFTSEAKQQLTQLIADIINTQKDIYLKNDLPSMLATDGYIKTREELRAEQRQKAKDLGVDL